MEEEKETDAANGHPAMKSFEAKEVGGVNSSKPGGANGEKVKDRADYVVDHNLERKLDELSGDEKFYDGDFDDVGDASEEKEVDPAEYFLHHKVEKKLDGMSGDEKFDLLWSFFEEKYGNAYIGADPSWIKILDTSQEAFGEMDLKTGREIVDNISSKDFIDRFLESEKCEIEELEAIVDDFESKNEKNRSQKNIRSLSQRSSSYYESDCDSCFTSDSDSEVEAETKSRLEEQLDDMSGDKRYLFIRYRSKDMLKNVLGREIGDREKDVFELGLLDSEEIIQRCIISEEDSGREIRCLYRDLVLWKKYISQVTRASIADVKQMNASERWAFLLYLANSDDLSGYRAHHIIENLFFQGIDISDIQTITNAVSKIQAKRFTVYCLHMFEDVKEHRKYNTWDAVVEGVKQDDFAQFLASYHKSVESMKASLDAMTGFDRYYFFKRKKYKSLLKEIVNETGSKKEESIIENLGKLQSTEILERFFASEYYLYNDAPHKDLMGSLERYNWKSAKIKEALDDMSVNDKYSFFYKHKKDLLKEIAGEQGSRQMNKQQKETLSGFSSTEIYKKLLESDYYTRYQRPLTEFLNALEDFKVRQKEKMEVKEKLMEDIKILAVVPEGLENVRQTFMDQMSRTNIYKSYEKEWKALLENPEVIMNHQFSVPVKVQKEMQQFLAEHLKSCASQAIVDLTKSEILQIIEEQMSLGSFLLSAEKKKRGNRCSFENETLKATKVLENLGYDLDGKNTRLFGDNAHRPLQERFSGLIERRVTTEEIDRFLKIYAFEEQDIPQEEMKQGEVEIEIGDLATIEATKESEEADKGPEGKSGRANAYKASDTNISLAPSGEILDDESDEEQMKIKQSSDQRNMERIIWRLTTSDIIELMEDNKGDFPRIEDALPEIMKNKELRNVDKRDFLNSLSAKDLAVVLTSLFDNNEKKAYKAISRKAAEKLLAEKEKRKQLETCILREDESLVGQDDAEPIENTRRMSIFSFSSEEEFKLTQELTCEKHKSSTYADCFIKLFRKKYDKDTIPSEALKCMAEEIDLGLCTLQAFDNGDKGGNSSLRQFVQQTAADMSIEDLVKTFLKQIPAEVAFMLVAQNENVTIIDFDKEKLKERGWWNPENAKSFQPTEIAWQNTFNIGMGIRVTAADGNMGSGLQVFKTLPPLETDNTEVANSGLKKILVKDTETLTRSIESSLEAEGSGWGASASASARAATKLEVSKKAIHATVYSYCIMGPTLPDTLNCFEVQETILEEFENDPDAFREKYGTHFIAGYKKGATFFGKMTYSTNDENHDLALESSIQLSPPVEIMKGPSAKTSSEYKKGLQKKNIDCTTEFVSTGGIFKQQAIEDGDMHALLKAAQETIHGRADEDSGDYDKDSAKNGYIKVTAILYPYEALEAFQNAKSGRLKYQRVVSDKALRELSKALLWYGKLEELCNGYGGHQDRVDCELFRNIKRKVYGEYQDRVREYSSCPAYDDYILDHIRLFRIDTMKDYEMWLQSQREAKQSEQAASVCRLWPFRSPDQQSIKESKKSSETKSVDLAQFNKLVGEDTKLTRIVIDGSSHNLGRHLKGAYLGVRLQKGSDIRTAESCYVCALKNRVFVHDSMHETNRVSIWARERVAPNTYYIRLFCNLDKTGVFAQGWYLTTSGNYLDDELRAPILAHHQRCYAALWKYVDHPRAAMNKSESRGKALMIVDGDDDGFSFTDGRPRYLACLEKKHNTDNRGTFFEDSVYAFLTTKRDEAAFIRFEEEVSIFTKDREEQKLQQRAAETPSIPTIETLSQLTT